MIIFDAIFVTVHSDAYKPEYAADVVAAIADLDDECAAVTITLAAQRACYQIQVERN
jgi:hypothetical protein